jgi:hypothetical protein
VWKLPTALSSEAYSEKALLKKVAAADTWEEVMAR